MLRQLRRSKQINLKWIMEVVDSDVLGNEEGYEET
jgi:hypothetical protein